MRQIISSNQINWINISLRWLVILGVAVSLFVGNYSYWLAGIFLVVFCAWNIFNTIVIILRIRLKPDRFLILFGDFVITTVIFILSGGYQGKVFWVGIMPLITAALLFSYKGGLIFAFANTIIQGLIGILINETRFAIVAMASLLAVYIAIGWLLAYFKEHVSIPIKKTRATDGALQSKLESPTGERYGTIYEIVSSLSSTLNYQRVLDTALDVSASALSNSESLEDRLVCAVLLYSSDAENETSLCIGSARRLTPADMRVILPGAEGLIAKATSMGEACYAENPEQDAELHQIVAIRACRSAGCLPLRTGLETYGVLVYAHPEPDFFTPDRRELLDIICNQVVIAIQNARLYRDLELEKERMMEIQEEARKKLARDLHDGPTQSIAALALRVNYARRLLERDANAAAEELFKVEELARHTTKEIRHMLFTLRPLVLESQGLIPALESMAEKMRETYNQEVIVQADARVIPNLEPSKQGVIFYIAEEAVNNARKHANAKHIWVRLTPSNSGIVSLDIEDDGVGFDPGEVNKDYENRSSLGMVNMRERTELVNGVLQIDSKRGKGTLVRIYIPTTEAAAERLHQKREF